MSEDSPLPGIKTFGFNCFANSALQCLAHLDLFMEHLTSNPEEITCIIETYFNDNEHNIDKEKTDEKSRQLLYINLKSIFIKLKENTESCIDPYNLIMSSRKYLSGKISEYLFDGEHQDMTEFIIFIVDFLHELQGKELKKINIKSDEEIKTNEDKITNGILKCCVNYYGKKFSWYVKKMSFFQINKLNCRMQIYKY